jgi:hypothetical protein
LPCAVIHDPLSEAVCRIRSMVKPVAVIRYSQFAIGSICVQSDDYLGGLAVPDRVAEGFPRQAVEVRRRLVGQSWRGAIDVKPAAHGEEAARLLAQLPEGRSELGWRHLNGCQTAREAPKVRKGHVDAFRYICGSFGILCRNVLELPLQDPQEHVGACEILGDGVMNLSPDPLALGNAGP